MLLITIAKRFWRDLCKKELVVVKLFYLIMVGANNTLFPYLTMHLRSLGITFAQTALLYTILPLMTWYGPSVAGYLVDRFGRLKIWAGIALLLAAVFGNCLLLVPAINEMESGDAVLNFTLISASKAGVFSMFGVANDCLPKLGSNMTVILGNCYSAHNMTTLLLETPEETGSIARVRGPVFEQEASNVSKCWVSVSRDTLCDDTNKNSVAPAFTLWLYFVTRMLSNVAIAAGSMYSETICFLAVQRNNGDYGLLRIWGALGSCIFSPLAGAFMDVHSFNVVFYLYGLLKVSLVGLLYFMPSCERPPDQKLNKNLRLLVSNGQVLALLLAMLLSGVMMGFLEHYLFIFLDESLNATKSLMGLTVLVANAAGMPVFLFASPLTNRFGHVNLLVAGFVCYAIRYIGFSLIQEPYWCLPFEFLEAVTNGLMTIIAVTYAAHLAPPSALATIEGMWAGLHFILGKGLGGVIGGLLYDAFGPRLTFRILAVFSLLVGIVYFLAYHCFLKSRGTIAEQQQKKMEVNVVAVGSSEI